MKFTVIAAQHPGDFGFWPNLGFGYIASYLRKSIGYGEMQVATSLEELAAGAPDLVGISSASQNYNEALRLARLVRSRLDAPLIIGGVHITALPSTLPPEAALAVLGEGEETIRELVSLYIEKGKFEPSDLARVRGIAYREGPDGQVKVTPHRPLIEPLDSIPHPDREILRYRGEDTYLFTSRGCPYSCRFCSSRLHWEKKLRCFSAEYVTEELRELWERYGTRRVHFYDDLFVADRKRLERMCELWQKEPWRGKIAFSCAVRAEAVDPELAHLLREMNFVRATFGAESQCPRILRYLKGASASPEANQRAVDLLAEAGIALALSFIKGSPTETREELETTYRFITANLRRRKIDGAETGMLVPFPGTETWTTAREKGIVREDMDWGLLRHPWEGLSLNPESQSYAAWDFLYAAKIRELRDLCQWEVIGTVADLGAPPPPDLIERLRRVRNVTQWVLPETLRGALSHEEGAPPRLIFARDAEKRWAEPARRRIHLRVTLESLQRPDALDGLVWHLYEDRLPAAKWVEGEKLLAEAVGPLQPADRAELESAAYVPGDSPLDPPDGIPADPAIPLVLQVACRQATALAEALQDRDNRLGRMDIELGKRTEWGVALSKEIEKARERILSLQREVEEKGRAALSLSREVETGQARILSLQQEVEEKNRWALALNQELEKEQERILSLQREVEEKGRAAKSLSREVETGQARILSLQQEVEDKNRWAVALNQELEKAQQRILALQREVEEKNRWALALDKELAGWRSGHARLEDAQAKGEKDKGI